MKHIFYHCALALALSSFTSCKQSKNEPQPLKVGVMSSMDYVPLAVAREKGLFEKYGAKVELQKFYSANERDAAFQSGNIDGTVIDYTGAILQKAGGVDLKITSACNATFCLMTADTTIRQIDDLKGKTVSVARNTVIDFCVEMALQSAGISVDEIEKQEINKIPIRLEMLLNGKSAATALPDPFISIATMKGAHSIVCMENLGYAVTGIMFKTAEIERKTAEIKAFYAAYNEAVDYIKSHPIEDIQSILKDDIGFPEPLLSSVRLPDYTHAGMPQEKDVRTVTLWLQGKKLIPENFPAESVLDNQFIQ
ncbi:MAG: ABC transporter substrate-binding protein [Dysgonamonadaceae bacterium]|jgi:NitT/TauT family transport system substrate-binding protein|nr:ABC transporter substrate-binding protein [Dysgonamonadaceae bacterium]